MNVNDNLIDGIYNFCDAWCERCLFTQRCRSYQIQYKNSSQPTDPSVTLVQQLTEALTLTKQYLDQAKKNQTPEGLTPAEQQMLEEEAIPVHFQAEQEAITQFARDYLRQTGDWLRDEKGLLEQAGQQQLHEVQLGIRTETEALVGLNALKDAWEMIKWYRTLIPVKTASALRAFSDSNQYARLNDYYMGKAKLILVSVNRSHLAWQTVLAHYPDKTDELLDMLVLLNRISREMETLFPDARTFQRPGLDT